MKCRIQKGQEFVIGGYFPGSSKLKKEDDARSVLKQFGRIAYPHCEDYT
jgi:hypothetical protein